MEQFLGIVLVAVGFLLVWKTDWFLGFFGRNDWAEEHFAASGGSRLLYKLMGLLACFMGVLALVGKLSMLGNGLASLVFG